MRHASRASLAAIVVVLLGLPALAGAGGLSGAPAHAAPPVPHGLPNGGPSPSLGPVPPGDLGSPLTAPTDTFGPRSPAVVAALSRLPAAARPGTWVYDLAHPGNDTHPLTSLPNLDLLEHPLTNVADVITPGYLSQPAPLGLADFGLGASPYAYDTPHILGSVTFLSSPNATDPGSTGVVNPGGAALGYVGSVDEFGIQLNTVLTNVSLPGNTRGTFWTQNVVNWNDTGLHFVSDTFNFSSGFAYIPPGTIVSGCNNDTSGAQTILDVYGGVFQCVGATLPLSPAAYPVTLQLYNNASVNGLRQDVLSYGYTVEEAGLGVVFAGVSDQIVFNDAGDAPAAEPPEFAVNGFTPSPLGLPEDAELVLVGGIGGDNAVFGSLNASLTLQYSNASVGGYRSVPSAYNFGTDTGETATGIADYWTAGHVLVAHQGPTLLYGLWNAEPQVSVASGHIHLAGSITPAYGFVFVSNTPPVADPWLNTSGPDNFSLLPTTSTGGFSTDLPPPGGAWTPQYYVQAFAPGSAEVNGTPVTGNVSDYALTLPPAPGSLDAPLYMFSAAEAAALARNVSGSALPPYTFANLTISPNASFSHLNDYEYPSFEIVLASGVGDVHVRNVTEGRDASGGDRYFFDEGYASSILGGDPLFFGDLPNYTSQVDLYFGTDDQVTDQPLFGEFGQGGALVLWGDRDAVVSHVSALDFSAGVFVGDSVGTELHGVSAFIGSVAVQDVGSTGTTGVGIGASDLSYGVEAFASHDETIGWINATDDSIGFIAGEDVGLEANTSSYYDVPGVQGLHETHLDAGSAFVAAEVAISSNVSFVNVSCSGTEGVVFLGTDNASVSDLRATDCALGVGGADVAGLGVDDSEFIGGLWDVLLLNSSRPSASGNVFFDAAGPAVNLSGTAGAHIYDNAFLYNDGSDASHLPTRPQAVAGPGNFFNSSAGVGNFWADWHTYSAGRLAPYPVSTGVYDEDPLGVAPGPVALVTFTETGLPARTLLLRAWTVDLGGIVQESRNTSMNYTLPVGPAFVLIEGPRGWTALPTLVAFSVTRPTTDVEVTFARAKADVLTFKERGLAVGRQFCVSLDTVPLCSERGVVRFAGLAPGSYAYAVTSPLSGQEITATVGRSVIGGANGSVTVLKSERVVLRFVYPYSIDFHEYGLPNGSLWSVTIKGQTVTGDTDYPFVGFALANGTYRFTVRTNAPGYHATPAHGRLVVDGAPGGILVEFAPKR